MKNLLRFLISNTAFFVILLAGIAFKKPFGETLIFAITAYGAILLVFLILPGSDERKNDTKGEN